MLWGFRTSKKHVADIDHVIAYLKEKTELPVWLVGTSRGTESAAFAAIHSQQAPAGVVLTSSMGEENGKGTAVTEMGLKKIVIPTLIVAHEDDQCWVTPPSAAELIRKRLVNAERVALQYFSGGDAPQSRACGARSPHGYFGIEEEVVDFIAAFIKRDL